MDMRWLILAFIEVNIELITFFKSDTGHYVIIIIILYITKLEINDRQILVQPLAN